MSEAIVIHNAYKHFGKANHPQWKRLSLNSLSQTAANEPSLRPEAKAIVALNHISFSVREGEIFGVVGPAGSGKSTLIRLIAALLLPDAGFVSVFGHDVVQHSGQVQRMLNRVTMESSLFKKMTPLENLVYGARLSGHTGCGTQQCIQDLLLRLGLDEHALYRPVSELCPADLQKTAIARAVLARPRLLLLDEPTAGLDKRACLQVQAVVRELNFQYGTTVLLTTRNLDEASALCERIVFIEGGNIIALNPVGAIQPAAEVIPG